MFRGRGWDGGARDMPSRVREAGVGWFGVAWCGVVWCGVECVDGGVGGGGRCLGGGWGGGVGPCAGGGDAGRGFGRGGGCEFGSAVGWKQGAGVVAWEGRVGLGWTEFRFGGGEGCAGESAGREEIGRAHV